MQQTQPKDTFNEIMNDLIEGDKGYYSKAEVARRAAAHKAVLEALRREKQQTLPLTFE
jgi:hypothetical protein